MLTMDAPITYWPIIGRLLIIVKTICENQKVKKKTHPTLYGQLKGMTNNNCHQLLNLFIYLCLSPTTPLRTSQDHCQMSKRFKILTSQHYTDIL